LQGTISAPGVALAMGPLVGLKKKQTKALEFDKKLYGLLVKKMSEANLTLFLTCN
jgi:hypothetical protein